MEQNVVMRKGSIKKFKEIIDYIFEATVGDGYKGSFSNYGTRFRMCLAEMIKRGIVVKDGTNANGFVFKWFNPAMIPNKNLYESVGKAVVLKEREYVAAYKKRRAVKNKDLAQKDTKAEVREEPIQEGIETKQVKENPLGSFTDDELWNELKSRGCYIEGGRLAKKVVSYFD